MSSPACFAGELKRHLDAAKPIVLRTSLPLAGVRGPLLDVAVGLVAAAASVQLVQAFLYGIPPHDLVTFVSAGVMVVLVAGMATRIPAQRATRIDPTEALRAD